MRPAFSDKHLLQAVLELKEKFKISSFYETGTWNGYTAGIASKHFDYVFSVENNMEFYAKAIEVNKLNKNVSLFLRDSVRFLDEHLMPEQTHTLFFLDAHWGEHWPLLDELAVIARKKIKPVILIHDFYVPDEHGNARFHFDSYKDVPLNYDYVSQAIEKIYGAGNFAFSCVPESEIGSGTAIFHPK